MCRWAFTQKGGCHSNSIPIKWATPHEACSCQHPPPNLKNNNNIVWALRISVMGKICAFFGHRDTPISAEIEKKLEKTVRDLINDGYDEFWVCEGIGFDWLARTVMLRLKEEYRGRIYLCLVLAYDYSKYPKLRQKDLDSKYEIIYLPEFEGKHPKTAILRRNKYIAENTDCVVCYLTVPSGGAYEAVKIANKNDKEIINIYQYFSYFDKSVATDLASVFMN